MSPEPLSANKVVESAYKDLPPDVVAWIAAHMVSFNAAIVSIGEDTKDLDQEGVYAALLVSIKWLKVDAEERQWNLPLAEEAADALSEILGSVADYYPNVER